jgi:predicted DNA-binding protein YlxM (UPF0122 family)
MNYAFGLNPGFLLFTLVLPMARVQFSWRASHLIRNSSNPGANVLTEYRQVNGVDFDQFASDDFEYTDTELECRELQEEIAAYTLAKLPEILTKKQWQIVELYLVEGLTQSEIANRLKLTQSTVGKTIIGVLVYGKPGNHLQPVQRRGGVLKKIREWVEHDDYCQERLKRIEELSGKK